MATLSQKATDGRLSFTKYVTDNKRLAEVQFQIEKGMKTPLFTLKANKWVLSQKEYTDSTTFKIVDTKLYEPTGHRLAKIKIGSVTGFFPITKIRKPTSGNGTAYEDEVVDAINSFILQNGGKIDLMVGTKTYKDMSYAIKVDSTLKRAGGVRGDPKADIIICADKNRPLAPNSIYISHKKEGGPEAFQQYGGISSQASDEIYNHKLVQQFLRIVSTELGDSNRLENPIMMNFKDDRLVNLSVYGPDFGKSFSLQHVQLIGQGKPVFTKTASAFKLGFSSHMSLSGDLSHFKNGYLPVFGATFRSGRGFEFEGKRYDGARLAIYPQKLMATRSGIVVFEAN